MKISGLGNFVIRRKADRSGRNPQSGEAITIIAEGSGAQALRPTFPE
ncbi:MAG: HU family DNA-binding protein [Geobacteraceae bacterium]|nr:HU family DNA-binding protein [Geobacteraceae bacterium]